MTNGQIASTANSTQVTYSMDSRGMENTLWNQDYLYSNYIHSNDKPNLNELNDLPRRLTHWESTLAPHTTEEAKRRLLLKAILDSKHYLAFDPYLNDVNKSSYPLLRDTGVQVCNFSD